MVRTVVQSFEELVQIKQNLIEQLTAQGVELSGNESFNALVGMIEEIEGTDPNLVVGENLLTANQSNVEIDLTGFDQIGDGIISQDLGTYWEGSASLQCVAVDGGPVMQMVLDAYKQKSTPMAFTFYAKGEGELEVTLTDGESNLNQVTFELTANWVRYTVNTGDQSDNDYLTIFFSGTHSTTTTFYLDGFKLEVGLDATPWVIGTGGSGEVPEGFLEELDALIGGGII